MNLLFYHSTEQGLISTDLDESYRYNVKHNHVQSYGKTEKSKNASKVPDWVIKTKSSKGLFLIAISIRISKKTGQTCTKTANHMDYTEKNSFNVTRSNKIHTNNSLINHEMDLKLQKLFKISSKNKIHLNNKT